ncbi:MAG: alpha-galactosidase, partial [Acidimicrobiales bacterium]
MTTHSEGRPPRAEPRTTHLTAGSTSLVFSATGDMPALLYWGPALGDGEAASIDVVTARPVARASLDVEAPIGLVAESSRGFPGSPGLVGHRPAGSAYQPQFGGAVAERWESEAATGITWSLTDPVADLGLEIGAQICHRSEVVQLAVTVTNTGHRHYSVERLAPTVALPAWADELLTFSGRWTLEFQPQRHRWQPGAWVSENRRGRTSHDRIPSIFAGTSGFDETSGQVWGLTLGWSGNSRVVAERLSDGRRHLQLGELLMAGELVLQPGESVSAPTVYGAHSDQGLGPVSRRFHRFLRGRSHHPDPHRPRPVMLNTWEAVYFDHDLSTLEDLASRAAEVGVERFVLDDGWFLGRNDDTSALGDWIVDPAKYPDGLTPLIGHVRSLDMEFGLWFEPEMVNPRSELFRDHPDWALRDDRYPELLGRNQLVLDLVNPEAWDHILGRLDDLLSEYEIGYIKWDMNRDLVQPTHDDRAGARSQTLALYRLIDELRRRHPDVEIESCSSGGGRADFEILARTERVWTSDSNDALDRQEIQRGFSMLFPPEVMGSHIGPPISHTTGRHHDLGLRAASAMLGHLGIEWNLLTTSADDRAEIADFVARYKQHRRLLHSGDWHRVDMPDPSVNVMGVVGADRAEALFVYARVGSALESVHGPVRLSGLDPDRRYRVQAPPLPGPSRDRGVSKPAWMDEGDGDRPVIVTGRVLMNQGLMPPVLDPESALIIHLRCEDEPAGPDRRTPDRPTPDRPTR